MSESAENSEEPHYDVVVVGAGFAGLGAALTLAESGARVLVCEALNYPGGCASTYKRGAYRFEAGATLFSGFGSGQLFRRWIDRYGLDITIDTLDPLVEFRAEALTLAVTRERGGLRDQLAALPGAPRTGLTAFFAEQQRVADALWPLLDEPGLLPPLDGAALRGHLAHLPTYLRLLPLLGRSLGQVLARHGLAEFRPLRAYLDALCQITVQCSAEEAEAPFALAALDYYYRGAGHVRGGIGRLACQHVGARNRENHDQAGPCQAAGDLGIELHSAASADNQMSRPLAGTRWDQRGHFVNGVNRLLNGR